MSSRAAKLVTVASNGQISIGKKWAGRQILIHEISESELRISSGRFIADRLASYYTPEAQEALKEFNHFAAKSPPKETDTKALKARILAKKKARGKVRG